MRRSVITLANTAMWLMFATLMCGGVVSLAGADAQQVWFALLQGAFGTQYNLSNTLVQSIPLLITGLAVILAFRAQTFNIGVEGQFLVGAICAVAMGGQAIPSPILLPLTLLSGMVGGAMWASVPGLLLHFRGIQVVLSSLLLNFVAVQFVAWVVRGPLQEVVRQYPQSDPILLHARLPRILPGLQMHMGVYLALGVAALVGFLLNRTRIGVQIRAVGNSMDAARTMGLPVGWILLGTLAGSGALAGLAGAVQICGVTYFLADPYSKGYGYTAIAVALVARLNPYAAIPAALVFGALTSGATGVQTAGIPSVVLLVIQAIILLSLLGARFTAQQWPNKWIQGYK